MILPSSNDSSTRGAAGPTDEETLLAREERIAEVEAEAAETVLGAVAGGIVGAMAGPAGIAAGAALGGGIGALLGRATRHAGHEEVDRQRDLDAGRLEPLPEDAVLPGRSAEELERELAASGPPRSASPQKVSDGAGAMPDIAYPVGVLFATREGHTRAVAEHVAAALHARGLAAIVIDVGQWNPGVVVPRLGMAIVAASVHAGHHEPEMVAFVRTHRVSLEAMPTVFLSVSLTEATVEDDAQALEVRARADAGVHGMIDAFFAETGWAPTRVLAVAGCLAYTKYGFIERLMMKHIARKSGGPLDTSHDHDLTDWQSLDRFVEATVGVVERQGVRLSRSLDAARSSPPARPTP